MSRAQKTDSTERPAVPIVLRPLLKGIAYDLSVLNVSYLTKTLEDGLDCKAGVKYS